jgi:hypothetical protein
MGREKVALRNNAQDWASDQAVCPQEKPGQLSSAFEGRLKESRTPANGKACGFKKLRGTSFAEFRGSAAWSDDGSRPSDMQDHAV